ncbi:MAG: IS630 family transposase [Parcubacteria group bacterium]
MLDGQTRGAVIRLSAEGHGSRKIAKFLSIAKKSVKKILRSGTDECPNINRSSKVDPYRDKVIQLISDCDSNLVMVHKKLAESGIKFSYNTLTAFCRRKKLVDVHSSPTHSVHAAKKWLSEILDSAHHKDMRVQFTPQKDLSVLLSYLKHGREHQRKKAAVVLAYRRRIPTSIIAKMLVSERKTIRNYLKIYFESGVESLFSWNTTLPGADTAADVIRQKRILEILHNKPTRYGMNRTSWTQSTLIQAYLKSHGENLSRYAVVRILDAVHYRWKKARRVLTSPDPNYNEKVELLLKTLHSLAADEMFFFLDEWGPVQVKMRGGKAYQSPDSVTEIPRRQTHRGTVSFVGALSATTNCMTWHFVGSKDSAAMWNLLEMLYNQYHHMRKIYVTWDAVAWHNSASLLETLDGFNEQTLRTSDGPIIELIPLPTSAQFLNVIEGVLSGMTRAVVHNSNYPSPSEMKRAISRHFRERNEFFTQNPKRAGKKIWELDFFEDIENLKSGNYREW